MCTLKFTAESIMLDDKFITPENVYDLSDEEMQTLIKTPASLRDILKVRESQHSFATSMERTLGSMGLTLDRIEKNLIVKKINGTVKEIPISEAVEELLQMHQRERQRSRFFSSLREFKNGILTIFIVLILASIYYHRAIDTFLSSLEGYALPIVGAGILAPLIVALITYLFKRKR